MMKLPTKPKTRVRENEEGQYEITLLFPMEDKAEFDELISAALKENDNVIDSNWETKTVTVATKDIKAFERRINFFRIMGVLEKP
jgi:putative IMPACT (imprinted ancient) family translation regulator